MFIVRGTKVTRQRRGQIAEFCPICRAPAWFNIARLTNRSHIYYIPTGRGTDLGHECLCRSCGLLLWVQPGAHFEPRKKVPAQEDPAPTIGVGSPSGPAVATERLALELRRRAGRITPDERTDLITTPFLVLDYLAQSQARRGNHQSVTAIIGLLAIIAFVPTLILGLDWFDLRHPPTSLTLEFLGCAAATLIFTALAGYRGLTSDRRGVHGKALKLLARALAPLRPSTQEIEAALATARQSNSALARLTSQQVASAIQMADLKGA